MKPNEARDLAVYLRAAVGGVVDAERIAYFEEEVAKLDADTATRAVMTGRLIWKRFPSWAEFREVYAAERKLSEPEAPPRYVKAEKIPSWIFRWVAARFLYVRFGRDQDMRPFGEQLGHVDETAEFMPDEEWIEEASHVTEADAWKAVLGE